MVQVELNNKNANPFYGMSNTLQLFQNGPKGNINHVLLSRAWNECKDLNQKAALLCVMFSIGDITSRQHSQFDGKVDTGGYSQREAFRDCVLPFLAEKLTKKELTNLIPLVVQYTTMDNILANRVQTRKGTNRVIQVINMIDVFGEDRIAKYVASIIKQGTEFEKTLVAKFLTRPRFGKRSGRKNMLPQTIEVRNRQASLIRKVSDLCKFKYTQKTGYTDFEGYYEWRRQYNQSFESVLFSTQSVLELDKEEFFSLLNMSPADARFRIRNKVLFSKNEDGTLKWGDLAKWYNEWEKFKEDAQAEQRALEEAIDDGTLDKDDIVVQEQLKAIKKKAKVNTGAFTLDDKAFADIVNGNIDELKIQPFLDKVNLPYNTLTFIDDSGSMTSKRGHGFSARQFAVFIALITLLKNPDPEARSLLGLFSNSCRMFNGIRQQAHAPNSLVNPVVKATKVKPIIDPKQTFISNLRKLERMVSANSTYNGTNVGSIARDICTWVNGDSAKLELIQRFPVWTLISDGNFNNRHNSTQSMLDFMRVCENGLGFKPFVILIDVAYASSANIENFSGIDNVMMVPPNPAAIETFLTRFRDMDTFDVYTPIQSLYRSNRYAPVRNLVYSAEKKPMTVQV